MASNKLTEEELITFMREMLAIKLSREQLAKPTKDFAVGVYSRFLVEFGFEDITQPDISATCGARNIERYKSSITIINIFKSTAFIVSAAGIPDMSMSDILVPKRKRTNRILSALCVLLVKLSNIQHQWCQLEQNYLDLPQKRATVEQKIRDYKRMIEQKSICLSANKNNTIALDRQLNRLAQTYEDKIKIAHLMEEESKSLKKHILNKKEKISEIDVEISKMNGKVLELESKVVECPDKVQAETSAKEQQLEHRRNEKRVQEKQHLKLLRSCSLLTETTKSFRYLLDCLTEALNDLEMVKIQCQQLHHTQIAITDKQKKFKSLKVIIREHEKSANTLKKKIANNEKQFRIQMATIEKINNGIKHEFSIQINNQNHLQSSLLEEKSLLENRLDYIKLEHHKFIAKSDMYYKQHLASTQMLNNFIITCFDQIEKHKNVRLYSL